MEELLINFIKDYINSNDVFAEDFEQLKQKLLNENQNNRKSIIVFSHKMDITLNSNNDKSMRYLLKNEPKFSQLFEKYLKKRIETNLENKRIWFCLKYKNLPEKRNVKTYSDLMSNSYELFSIDCLQIVSLSQTFKSVIGRKMETKESIKWQIKRLRETNFKTLSDNYRELKEERVFTQKRLIQAIIVSNDPKNSSNIIEITIFLEILDENEVQFVYNGSHLNSVVLLKIESEYVLLSFDKIIEPIPQLINNFQQYLLQFPQEFRELFIDRKQSNYSFALSLAFIFADNISIIGSFFRLKLGLLLSLLSLNEYPKKNHSSVLVICDDTLMTRRLFEWSTLLSKYRYLQKSVSVPITGKSRGKWCNSSQNVLNYVDSGALQLGADGITIIESVPNLNQLPDKERTALFHALETNEAIARLSQPSDPSLVEFELKSTVWAMIEDNIDERQYHQKFNKSHSFDWTQVFGMVYRISKTSDNYIYRSSQTNASFSLEEWQTIIGLMSTIAPQMTETAENLLKGYYVSNRRIRGSKLNHISFETLISLSKSMSKLSLRLNVSKYDALMAILLYEESLTTCLPERESPLSVKPLHHLMIDQMNEFIGKNCDQFMDRFDKTLLEFVNKENTNINNNSEVITFTQNEE